MSEAFRALADSMIKYHDVSNNKSSRDFSVEMSLSSVGTASFG
jgi:hypothetical protein